MSAQAGSPSWSGDRDRLLAEGGLEIEGCASGDHPPWEEICFDPKHNLRVVGTVCDDRRVEMAFRGTVMDNAGSRSVRGVGVDNALTDVNSQLVVTSPDSNLLC